MTIVLHIGFTKTGSSALQYGFERNAAALARAGIHYAPGAVSALSAAGHITSGNGGPLARYLVPSKRPAGYDPAAFPATFARIYLSSGLPTTLISSEALSLATPEMLVRFRDEVAGDRPLVVVALIRDLYGHARSAWMQGIKRHATVRSFDEFLARAERPPQVMQLRAYTEALGRETIRLLHYESVRADLFGAFLGALGATVPDIDTSLPAINRSLSPVEAEVLRACNAVHRDPALSRLVSDRLIERYPDRPTAAAVDPAHVARLAERYAEDLAWVNDTYFGGEPVLGIAGPARPAEADPVTTDAVWADVVATLVEALHRDAPAAEQRRKR